MYADLFISGDFNGGEQRNTEKIPSTSRQQDRSDTTGNSTGTNKICCWKLTALLLQSATFQVACYIIGSCISVNPVHFSLHSMKSCLTRYGHLASSVFMSP